MSDKKPLNPVTTALGAAFAGSVMLAGAVNAADNPFGLSELGNGYMQIATSHMEGKCGEGKCGGDKSSSEGKCGEGKCGGTKAMSEGKCGEGKCGENKAKAAGEGKCGEGKCGGKQ
jgi:uncharacterized low-complexity protein